MDISGEYKWCIKMTQLLFQKVEILIIIVIIITLTSTVMQELYIPIEIHHLILQQLSKTDLFCLANTCKYWNEFIKANNLLPNELPLKNISRNVLSYISDLVPKEKLCGLAFQTGNLEVLKWARENNYKWLSHDFVRGAKYGRLDVLKWALDNGFKFNRHDKYFICQEAAKENYLKTLKWLR